MPDSPETNLEDIKNKILEIIKEFYGEIEFKTEVKEVAFGLKSLDIIFVMDENKGSTEKLENKISELEGITSVEVTDVRRAIG